MWETLIYYQTWWKKNPQPNLAQSNLFFFSLVKLLIEMHVKTDGTSVIKGDKTHYKQSEPRCPIIPALNVEDVSCCHLHDVFQNAH